MRKTHEIEKLYVCSCCESVKATKFNLSSHDVWMIGREYVGFEVPSTGAHPHPMKICNQILNFKINDESNHGVFTKRKNSNTMTVPGLLLLAVPDLRHSASPHELGLRLCWDPGGSASHSHNQDKFRSLDNRCHSTFLQINIVIMFI